MWTYRPNGDHPDDGYILISPDDREIGIINAEADAKNLCELLNDGLKFRKFK